MAIDNDTEAGSIDVQLDLGEFPGTMGKDRRLFSARSNRPNHAGGDDKFEKVWLTHQYRGIEHGIVENDIGALSRTAKHIFRFFWTVLERWLEIRIDGEMAATFKTVYPR